jgi:hypothetical protein
MEVHPYRISRLDRRAPARGAASWIRRGRGGQPGDGKLPPDDQLRQCLSVCLYGKPHDGAIGSPLTLLERSAPLTLESGKERYSHESDSRDRIIFTEHTHCMPNCAPSNKRARPTSSLPARPLWVTYG